MRRIVWSYPVAILSLFSSLQPKSLGVTITPPDFCVEISSPLCSALGYQGGLPNILGITTREAADEALETYTSLYSTGCSNAMLHFICLVYYPICIDIEGEIITRIPCRELCEYVQCTCLDVVRDFGAEWPEDLQCSRFPYDRSSEDSPCTTLTNGTQLDSFMSLSLPRVEIDGVTRPQDSQIARCGDRTTTLTPTTEEPSSLPTKFQCPVAKLRISNDTPSYQDYQLYVWKTCGLDCNATGLLGGAAEATTFHVVIPTIILTFAILGFICSVFTMTTFLIDRSRFPYPERPFIHLTVTYFVLSVLFIINASLKLGNINFTCPSGFNVLQNLPNTINDGVSYEAGSCVTLAVFLYYTTMASYIWWVILTVTWFMAATLKWAEEAIAKFWLLYHTLAWGLPLILIIFMLAFQTVDGDTVAGICYPGNFNVATSAAGVLMPMFVFIATGTIIFVIGFISLNNIRRQVQDDPVKNTKLKRLILRVLTLALAITIPNVILIIVLLFQISQQEQWELHAVCQSASAEEKAELGACDGLHSGPSLMFYIFKYAMWTGVSCSTVIWVISRKTINSYKVLFQDLGQFVKVSRRAPSDPNPNY